MATIIEERDKQLVADYNHVDVVVCHLQAARVVSVERVRCKEARHEFEVQRLKGVVVLTSRVDRVDVQPLVAGSHEDYRPLHVNSEYTQVYLSLEQLKRALRKQGLEIIPASP